MIKIEHIGIAVADEAQAIHLFTTLLGQAPYKTELVKDQKVNTTFYIQDHTKIELLSATDDQSPIAKFVGKRGEGMHHIAFAVDNIYEEMCL
jgi:methylmalonyl-CoA/ethylmalonyl-CoA epimerase